MPKPCQSNQIRNPYTGRCVKRSGAIGKRILGNNDQRSRILKPCPSNQIRNPDTGRCVKRSGAIGKRILGNNDQRSRVLKPCPSNQIRNPDTGRCVKRSGAIGKHILEQRRLQRSRSRRSQSQRLRSQRLRSQRLRSQRFRRQRSRSRQPPSVISKSPTSSSFDDFSLEKSEDINSNVELSFYELRPLKQKNVRVNKKYNKILQKLAETNEDLNGVYVDTLLGKGSYGAVYKICRGENRNQICQYAMKVFLNDSSPIQHEINMFHLFYNKLDFIPQIKADFMYNSQRFLLMEQLDDSLDNMLVKYNDAHFVPNVFELIKYFVEHMWKQNLVHYDLHFGNICYTSVEPDEDNRRKSNYVLIDFGFSGEKKSRIASLIQPIRVCNPIFHTKISEAQLKELQYVLCVYLQEVAQDPDDELHDFFVEYNGPIIFKPRKTFLSMSQVERFFRMMGRAYIVDGA